MAKKYQQEIEIFVIENSPKCLFLIGFGGAVLTVEFGVYLFFCSLRDFLGFCCCWSTVF